MSSDNGGDQLPRGHGVIGMKSGEGKRDFGENNTANNTKQIAVAILIVSIVWIIGARVKPTIFYAIFNRPRYFASAYNEGLIHIY